MFNAEYPKRISGNQLYWLRLNLTGLDNTSFTVTAGVTSSP